MAIAAMVFIIVGTVGWNHRAALVLAVAGIVMLLGSIRFMFDYRQNDVAQFYDQKISGTGQILEEPGVRSDKTYLTLGNINLNGQKLKSKILFSVGRFPEYEYGQTLRFEAKVMQPKEAEAAGEFSYKDYLSRFGVDAVAYQPKISDIKPGGNWVRSNLLKFKGIFIKKLELMLPEPQSSFLGGLLVGLRRSIPEDLKNALATTGTTHVIAISGFNITIIASVINNFLLRFFRRRISFILAITAIILFVILTGASASAVRAGVMGVLAMLAQRLGRVNAITNALTLTAVIMLIINPQILHFDAGFLLSFLALLGLVYLAPILETKSLWIPGWLRDYLIPTTAAYIFTLPFLLYTFGRLSLVAIPTNILVLPMIPVAMFFGFLAGAVGLISQTLAYPVVWLAWGSLSYVLAVIKWFAAIPFAALSLHLPAWVAGLCYILLAIFMFGYNYPQLWKPKPKIS